MPGWVGSAPVVIYSARIISPGPTGFVTVRVSDDLDIDGNTYDVTARGAGTVGAYVTVAVSPNGTARIV